jgi:predicted RNA-binding Zn-ribbon protein involved in translation (DUF1610 family)
MPEYYLVCTQCKRETPITEKEAQFYGSIRVLTDGATFECSQCGGAVKGEIREKPTLPGEGKEQD